MKKGSLLTYRVCERATERNIGYTDKSERHTDKPEREREERVGRKDINLTDSRREKFLFHSQRQSIHTWCVEIGFLWMSFTCNGA